MVVLKQQFIREMMHHSKVLRLTPQPLSPLRVVPAPTQDKASGLCRKTDPPYLPPPRIPFEFSSLTTRPRSREGSCAMAHPINNNVCRCLSLQYVSRTYVPQYQVPLRKTSNRDTMLSVVAVSALVH